jgi:hypothetical protein
VINTHLTHKSKIANFIDKSCCFPIPNGWQYNFTRKECERQTRGRRSTLTLLTIYGGTPLFFLPNAVDVPQRLQTLAADPIGSPQPLQI